jgi:hypothetical protein
LIRELSSQNLGISEISERTGYDGKTVRKYLEMKTLPGPQKRPGRKSKLDPFKPYMLKEGPYTATRLYREIKEMGFDGGKIIASFTPSFIAFLANLNSFYFTNDIFTMWYLLENLRCKYAQD